MGDSQQDLKKKIPYEAWTKEQSDMLLALMVDGARHGWRDNSGIFSKQTVEERILPSLNEKLKCKKTYAHYQSRLKWYKNRWTSYSNLMKFSSGFEYDAMTKRFTASDEVWDSYLAAHSKDVNLRYADCSDYEDLEMAIGNGVAIGKNSIGLGSSTYARTILEDLGSKDARIEDLTYDEDNMMFVSLADNEPPLFSTPLETTPHDFTMPEIPEVATLSTKTQKKRSRAPEEATSSSKDGLAQEIKKITSAFGEVHDLLRKREEKREKERSFTTWDAIKEIPNLDEETRLKAFDSINTKSKKDGFLRMTIEERARWIAFKLK